MDGDFSGFLVLFSVQWGDSLTPELLDEPEASPFFLFVFGSSTPFVCHGPDGCSDRADGLGQPGTPRPSRETADPRILSVSTVANAPPGGDVAFSKSQTVVVGVIVIPRPPFEEPLDGRAKIGA